jgi:hypothetical protein
LLLGNSLAGHGGADYTPPTMGSFLLEGWLRRLRKAGDASRVRGDLGVLGVLRVKNSSG